MGTTKSLVTYVKSVSDVQRRVKESMEEQKRVPVSSIVSTLSENFTFPNSDIIIRNSTELSYLCLC